MSTLQMRTSTMCMRLYENASPGTFKVLLRAISAHRPCKVHENQGLKHLINGVVQTSARIQTRAWQDSKRCLRPPPCPHPFGPSKCCQSHVSPEHFTLSAQVCSERQTSRKASEPVEMPPKTSARDPNCQSVNSNFPNFGEESYQLRSSLWPASNTLLPCVHDRAGDSAHHSPHQLQQKPLFTVQSIKMI